MTGVNGSGADWENTCCTASGQEPIITPATVEVASELIDQWVTVTPDEMVGATCDPVAVPKLGEPHVVCVRDPVCDAPGTPAGSAVWNAIQFPAAAIPAADALCPEL